MQLVLLATLLGLSLGQERQCAFTSDNGRYVLNLTRESTWTAERQEGGFEFYYTPCRNGLQCRQGNADFYANTAQYRIGENQCTHYLSVDHHQQAEYLFYGAAWRFAYDDGELCDTTQQPRRTTIYYHCNEEINSPLFLYGVNEPQPCNYVFDIRGNAACVPENSHNSNCQWRTPNGTGGYYYLDLSPLNTSTLYSRLPNGYYHTITPCRNGLHCWQQYGQPVMGVIDNHATGTCEHYGAIWEDGRVQPVLHNAGQKDEHWSFHYFNGQTCGSTIGEEELRFYCDPTADEPKVINATNPYPCRFDINIATKYACTSQANLNLPNDYTRPPKHRYNDKKSNKKQYYKKKEKKHIKHFEKVKSQLLKKYLGN